jgi:CRISPR/Cas system CSM-associated protein Csm3 (group 7 of RAMP superfamily)
MMEMSKMTAFTTDDVKVLFNRLEGITDEPRLSISNLTISDYDVVSRELAQLEEQYPTVFTKDRVLEEYTSMRYYTSIDQTTGTAMEGTLHNSRVLNKGLTFKGHIGVENMTDTDRYILSCAVRNMMAIGGKRNRGFGQVVCKIDDKAFDLDTIGGKLWNK